MGGRCVVVRQHARECRHTAVEAVPPAGGRGEGRCTGVGRSEPGGEGLEEVLLRVYGLLLDIPPPPLRVAKVVHDVHLHLWWLPQWPSSRARACGGVKYHCVRGRRVAGGPIERGRERCLTLARQLEEDELEIDPHGPLARGVHKDGVCLRPQSHRTE